MHCQLQFDIQNLKIYVGPLFLLQSLLVQDLGPLVDECGFSMQNVSAEICTKMVEDDSFLLGLSFLVFLPHLKQTCILLSSSPVR